jgi:glycerol-3-phosphate acyltransferase PlsX
MRIVVDAMGTDEHPGPDVAGAVLAAREWGGRITLVGDRATIEQELAKHAINGLSIDITHAGQVVEMADKPVESSKHKPDSSMHVGLGLVASREADAFVSAGNTGAILAIATLQTLKRIPGVSRPTLTAIFQNRVGYTVAADIGANADCKPEYLAQFGLMASLYAELALKISQPRVALLSNGEEEDKGNALIKESAVLLKAVQGINFIGNVEPKEVLNGETDVVISDGFAGNVFIKSMEAAASMMSRLIREEIMANPVSMLGGALVRPAFKRVAARLDPFEIGGAVLLGLQGIVIVAHGRSNDIAIKNAIRQARQAVQSNLVDAIQAGINA